MNKRERIKVSLLANPKGLTKEALLFFTSQSPDGLRGRIAELRKQGYDIEYKETTQKVYILTGHEWTAQQEIFIKENMFKYNAEWIAKKLKLPTALVSKKLDTYGGLKQK